MSSIYLSLTVFYRYRLHKGSIVQFFQSSFIIKSNNNMAMSTMPTYFPESADQSSSPELFRWAHHGCCCWAVVGNNGGFLPLTWGAWVWGSASEHLRMLSLPTQDSRMQHWRPRSSGGRRRKHLWLLGLRKLRRETSPHLLCLVMHPRRPRTKDYQMQHWRPRSSGGRRRHREHLCLTGPHKENQCPPGSNKKHLCLSVLIWGNSHHPWSSVKHLRRSCTQAS